jgi:hypothetical protein
MPPNFYFFTDADLLNTQSQNEAYGPVLSGDPDYQSTLEKWRVSSMHKASSDPLAYAICDGDVLVQEDLSSSGTLVNIILKPKGQPVQLGVDLPEVRYYVYRGIRKDSLFDSLGVVFPAVNTLTKRINDDYGATVSARAPAYLTGIERNSSPSFDISDPLDNLFYVLSNATVDPTGVFQKFPIFGGDSIGRFAKESFGIEIILNRMQFKGTLGEFRNHIHHLAVSPISDIPTSTHWEMSRRMDKEQLLNYLDISAFYGAFQGVHKLFARASTAASNPVDFTYTFEDVDKDDVYEQILEGNFSGMGLAGRFWNRSTFYLDIQNELGYSYNQMRNYADTIKLLVTNNFATPLNTANGADRNYYDNGPGAVWPMLRLTPGNTLNFPYANEDNNIRVAMPDGDNYPPLDYIAIGKIARDTEGEIRLGKSKFFAPVQSEKADFYFSEFALTTPAVNISGTWYAVSRYARVCHFRKLGPKSGNLPSGEFALRPHVFLDLLFPVFDLKNLFPDTSNTTFYLYDNDVFVDLKEYTGTDFVGKPGIARDQDYTTLFVMGKESSTQKKGTISNNTLSISSESLNHYGAFLNYIDDLENKSKLVFTTLTIGTNPFQINRFKVTGSDLEKDLDKVFLSVVFPNDKYDNLSVIAANKGFDSNLPLYFCVGEEVKMYTEGKSQITNLNQYLEFDDGSIHKYLKLPFHLKGYIDNGGNLEIDQTKSDTSNSDPQLIIHGHTLSQIIT